MANGSLHYAKQEPSSRATLKPEREAAAEQATLRPIHYSLPLGRVRKGGSGWAEALSGTSKMVEVVILMDHGRLDRRGMGFFFFPLQLPADQLPKRNDLIGAGTHLYLFEVSVKSQLIS